jgi:hypothetical protein
MASALIILASSNTNSARSVSIWASLPIRREEGWRGEWYRDVRIAQRRFDLFDPALAIAILVSDQTSTRPCR